MSVDLKRHIRQTRFLLMTVLGLCFSVGMLLQIWPTQAAAQSSGKTASTAISGLAGSPYLPASMPGLPGGYFITGITHDLQWLLCDLEHDAQMRYFNDCLLQNPADGSRRKLPRISGHVTNHESNPFGEWLVGEASTTNKGLVAFFDRQGKLLTHTGLIARQWIRLGSLSDGSLLIFGGYDKAEKPSMAVEIIQARAGALHYRRLPDVPGPVRSQMFGSAVADGQWLMLGGRHTDSKGDCPACGAHSYLLDTGKAAWLPGPPLRQGRFNAAAIQLPDKRILVSGGSIRKEHVVRPTHSTEIWSSKQTGFVPGPDLALPASGHRLQWLEHQGKRWLLATPGANQALQVLDESTQTWSLAAQVRSDEAGLSLPFFHQNQWWLWHIAHNTLMTNNDKRDLRRDYVRSLLLPGKLDQQGKSSGYAMRLHEDYGTASGIRYQHFSPANGEQIPARFSHTILSPGKDESVDGTLIEFTDLVYKDGRMVRIPGKFQMPPAWTDKLAAEITTPPLPRPRQEATRKTLADGRVIIAGGKLQTGKIALVQENSLQPDAPDSYAFVGEFHPSRRHDIWDSKSKRWQLSAPSAFIGGEVAILDDGSVYKLGSNPQQAEKITEKFRLEASSADGKRWQAVSTTDLQIMLDYNTRLLSSDDEIFLSGNNSQRDILLQWLDRSQGKWQTLWRQAYTPEAEYLYEHQGRILIRTLANGKRVVLPLTRDRH